MAPLLPVYCGKVSAIQPPDVGFSGLPSARAGHPAFLDSCRLRSEKNAPEFRGT